MIGHVSHCGEVLGGGLTLFSVGTFFLFLFRDIRLSRMEGVDSLPSPTLRSE